MEPSGNEDRHNFAVYDRKNGEQLGVYYVSSRKEALEALARDAEYESFAEACADVGGFGEGLDVKKLRG